MGKNRTNNKYEEADDKDVYFIKPSLSVNYVLKEKLPVNRSARQSVSQLTNQ